LTVTRLKKLLAETRLEAQVSPRGAEAKVVTVPAKRELVRFAQGRGMSERRALKLVGMSPSVLRYERRDDGNGELRERIVAMAHRHRAPRLPDDSPAAAPGGLEGEPEAGQAVVPSGEPDGARAQEEEGRAL